MKYKVDYNTWKYLNGIILEVIQNFESLFYTRMEGKIHFSCLFREGSNHFICIPSFSLRVYLVIAESKIEKISLIRNFICIGNF